MVVAKPKSPYSESQPFVRSRVDKNGYTSQVPSTVDRDNALLQRKLKEIQRRPHTASCSTHCKHASVVNDDGVCSKEPWESFKVHSHIQPSSGKSPTKQRDKQIQHDNRVLHRKLQECYAIRRDSFVVANHLGQGVDCNDLWTQRTDLYAARSGSGRAHKSARPKSAPLATAHKVDSTTAAGGSCRDMGVPKTLGVASCAGCGQRSYYQADGVQLKPCTACKQVYYCSETCARIDQPSHKALCRYHTTGLWAPAGIRPTADCWVMNTAMTAARKLLRQQQRNHCGSSSSTLMRLRSSSTKQKPLAEWTVGLKQANCMATDNSAVGRAYSSADTTDCAAAAEKQAVSTCDETVGNDCTAVQVYESASYEPVCPGEMVYRRQHTTSSSRLICSSSLAVCGQQAACQTDQKIAFNQQPQQYHKHSVPCSRWDVDFDKEQQILQQLAAVRLQELDDDRRLSLVEWRANQGMAGPRPCCYDVRRKKQGTGTLLQQKAVLQK